MDSLPSGVLRMESGLQFLERTRSSSRPRLMRIVPFPRRFEAGDVIEVSSHVDCHVWLAHLAMHAALPRCVNDVPTGFSEAQVLYVDCNHHRKLSSIMKGVAEHLVRSRGISNVDQVVETSLNRIKKLSIFSEVSLHKFFEVLPDLVVRLPDLALVVIDDLASFHFEHVVEKRSLERHIRSQIRLLKQGLKRSVISLPIVYSKKKWSSTQYEKWNSDLTFRLGIDANENGYVQSGDDKLDLVVRVHNEVEVDFA